MAKSVGWMRRGEVYLKVSLIDGTRFRGGKPSKDGQVVFGELGNERAGGKLLLRSRWEQKRHIAVESDKSPWKPAEESNEIVKTEDGRSEAQRREDERSDAGLVQFI